MAEHPASETCPTAETLQAFVTGVLAEEKADVVFAHLDRCQPCQRKIDDVAARPDSLIQNLRKPLDGYTPHDRQKLAVMIAELEQADPLGAEEVVKPRSQERELVSFDEFTRAVRQSGVVERPDIASVLSSVDSKDVSELAREFVSRGLLTSFQAGVLLNGRRRGLILGNYVLLNKIGRGGMGRVFKARHRKMGRVVCLKILRREARKSTHMLERFEREAIAVGAMHHPNIVVAHDASQEDDIPFIVMEYIAGEDLSKYVTRRGPLDPVLAGKVVLQCTLALDYAHQQGVIHRDVKPSNIMLTKYKPEPGEEDERKEESKTELDDDQTPGVKILDLGLARFNEFSRRATNISDYASMTDSGTLMGTVDYMAPEQAVNSRKADTRSDIYGLGCTLYYLLSGQPMYEGETAMEKLVAHREQPIPNLYQQWDVPKELSAIFAKAVAKKPEDRYQSMVEFGDDIQRWLVGVKPLAMTQGIVSQNDMKQLIQSVPSSDPEPPRVNRQRRQLWTAIIITATMTAALLGVVMFLNGKL